MFFIPVEGVGKALWGDKPETWKWAYGQAEIEAQRTTTSDLEIEEAYWRFTVLRHLLSN